MRTDLLVALGLLGTTLGCRDGAESPAAPDAPTALATTASTLVFAQLSAGGDHSCGVTTDNRVYCWGRNSEGQLGDGTITNRPVPVAVLGGLHFRQVTTGATSTCAVTTDNRAYCWGGNVYGQLGIGSTSERLTPAAVSGGRLFRRVEIYSYHVCGVTTADRAFCWGRNTLGQLGIGNNTGPQTGDQGSFSKTPVAVVGGLTFSQVGVGHNHSCGVTLDGRMFCWGHNQYGQVGDSSNGWLKFKPVRVAGTQQYRQVEAGLYHTCAVTTGNRAFCWGRGKEGQLGYGGQGSKRWPWPVSGGLSIRRVSGGEWSTCAETTTNRAYCWPDYSTGTGVFTPVAVPGGLLFAQLNSGPFHSCGKTPEGRGYCWGTNYPWGKLGDGTTDNSATPVPVAAPM